MTKSLSIFALFLSLLSCNNEQKEDFSEYYEMDKVELSDDYFSPRKTPIVPFIYNKIYDPFLFVDSAYDESVYEEGKHSKLKVIVLDSIETTINNAVRKRKNRLVKAIPVIIYNSATIKSNYLFLHRGSAMIIQEAKNKKGEWIEIERFSQSKMGKFYYRIKPKKYIYTKIPLYQGNLETTLRVKLFLNDTEVIYSNEYLGSVKDWMVR